MIILYVNNYRGFQDTYIPLADVNFLVGENSSGKTSILSLLQVLSSESFWYRQEFGLENLNLAFFQEVITAGCKDDFFEVAMFGYDRYYEKTAFYFKFKDNQGKPTIQERKSLTKDKTTYIKEKENGTECGFKETILESGNDIDSFKKWLEVEFDDSEIIFSYNKHDKNPLHFSFAEASSYFIKTKKMESQSVYLNSFEYMQDFTPIAPIRAKPQRIYEGYKISFTTDGDHIPYLLKSIMESANHSDIKKNVEVFGDNSGLFEKLQIKKLGDDNISPFEIHISLNGNVMKLTNVGYGVSQILPILVEILSKKDGTWFAIQQPEVHLHPKAQAALGELFFNIAKAENKSFLIETHSDYLIDRYRLALRRANKKLEKPASNAQVLFFERTAEGNKVHILPIDERGDYPEEQPEGFRDFFINEELNLLTY